LLTQRFAFHHCEPSGLYEALEAYLVGLASEIDDRAFVVGEAFSAADLTLAALLRPLTIVPFFAEDPRLDGLFVRSRRVLDQWAGAGEADYQRSIAQARARRAPLRRRIRRARSASLPLAPRDGFADNDQRPLGWSTVAAPFHCMRLRQNKVRAARASDAVR
jgi:glutathione S-transferase